MNYTKVLACIFMCIPFNLLAQKRIRATELTPASFKSLSTHFSRYSLFEINTAEIKTYAEAARKGDIDLELALPGLTNFHMSLKEDDILSDQYQLTVFSSSGKQVFRKQACLTYAGKLSDEANSRVRLTITNDLIYGTIKSNTKEYFIEPLKYFSTTAASGVFIIYETKDAILDPSFICGVSEREQAQQKMAQSQKATAGLNCVVTQMAIASDESMFTRYGSVQAVEVIISA